MLDDDHSDDLAAPRHTPAGGEAEQQVRRFGRNSLTAGLILAPLTLLLCLGAAVATNNEWDNRDAQLFTTLAVITLMVASGGLIVIGGMERLHRPVRRRQQQSVVDAARLRRTVEAGLADHRERFDDLLGLGGSLSGRLDGIDLRMDEMTATIQAVPDYGRGVVDGMAIRHDAFND